ncbi:MAG: UDP-N-acetylglucosamine 4,6-dehydratase (inverting) [Oscillospiraceae bacterium]|jgi:UDP-N-acetylglucosamine 4,6-dehydratase (inverting)|nr:UDP-N-acetylglucosamine 4,6-dehydratase (inverting) [Oscillospiraceae bacterium]
MLNGASILITGGTGSFGKNCAKYLLANYDVKKIIIFSRDEYKQFMLRQELPDRRLRFFVGDVRDKYRLKRAFDGVDYVLHAAAMKQVPTCEYNPIEAIKTNVNGAANIVDAALDAGVKKVIALSTDKAVNPINLYGGTKLLSDKLFVAANYYVGGKGTVFAVVRYGNVAGSRGSVISHFQNLAKSGARNLPITDQRMTRFWIGIDKGIELALKALELSRGGEIFVSKIPSFKVTDLARAILPGCGFDEIGIREGEKLHEIMITEADARFAREFEDHYLIYSHLNMERVSAVSKSSGAKLPEGFSYSSDNNTSWLGVDELRALCENIKII